MDFVAIDFETANCDFASICQVGIVGFENNKVCESWQTLVNPDDAFSPINVSIHGIDEQAVADAPRFPEIYNRLSAFLRGRIVVCHTHFDKTALIQAIEHHHLEEVPCTWLDTARVVRRTWSEFCRSGYGLKNVAKWLCIEFNHHEAVEDARAAGEILIRAMEHTGFSITEWLYWVRQPIPFDTKAPLEEIMSGEEVVFTGTLPISRKEAAARAVSCGCRVCDNVTTRTTILVIGDQDVRKLAGREKSNKHRRAEELILSGQPIRIIRGSDFRRLLLPDS